MKKLLLAALLACGAAYSQTVITDTLPSANGVPLNGYMTFTWSTPFNLPNGTHIAAGTIQNVPITNGAFTVSLYPTDTSTPPGVTYSVQYYLQSPYSRSPESWYVYTSATPLKISQVYTTVPPSVNIFINPSQINPSGCIASQAFVWTGSAFTCQTVVTSGPQNAGTFFRGPLTGSPASPIWAGLVSADIPNNAANTTGAAAGLTGYTIPGNGTKLLTGTGSYTSGDFAKSDGNGNLIDSTFSSASFDAAGAAAARAAISACSANQYATATLTSGITCAQVAYVQVSGTPALGSIAALNIPSAGIVKSSGAALSAAVSGTDYAPATTGTSLLKASSGGFANAVAGTDYASATATLTINSVSCALGASCTVASVASFSGSLLGDVTGTQGATSVVKVNGQSVAISAAYLASDSSGHINAATTPVTALTGTANQVTASASTGSVTLSLPTYIAFPNASIFDTSAELSAQNVQVGGLNGNAPTTSAWLWIANSGTGLAGTGGGMVTFFDSAPAANLYMPAVANLGFLAAYQNIPVAGNCPLAGTGAGATAGAILSDSGGICVLLNAANVFTGSTTSVDLHSVTNVNGLRPPSIANCVTTADAICLDSTAGNMHMWTGSDLVIMGLLGAGSYVTNDIPKITVTSGRIVVADSGLLYSNLVTSSSPGIGICHFAGSTQACTSSAVNLASADVTGNLPLSQISGASASTTIQDGNNPVVFQSATTTNSQAAFKFNESAAATGTSDIQVQISTSAGSTASPLVVGSSYTGSQTNATLQVLPTWNTSGNIVGIYENVTNTGSGASSYLLDLAVGSSAQFGVGTTGKATTYNALATAGEGLPPVLAAIRSTGLTGAVSNGTSLCGAGATACGNAGTYNIHIALYQSGSACSANTTNGVSPNLTWTDGNGTAHTAQGFPVFSNGTATAVTGTMAWGATTVTGWGSADINVDTNGTAIGYGIAFAQCTTGTATYAASLVVTRLQ